MADFHLFNPENDLALGIGCHNYTPPPHAAALHHAGALLPMWLANPEDRILAPESLSEHAGKLRAEFGLNGEIGFDHSVSKLTPWGWSLDAKRQFVTAGATSDSNKQLILPTDDEIERMRQLSHRRTSIEILRALDYPLQIPVEATDADTVVRMEAETPGCFIKSPWSCSGRGVFNAMTLDEGTLRKRVEGIINRQGSVMVEHGLNKTMDFAALFFSDGNYVKFCGLSMFQALNRGMYAGNIVASQPEIRRLLSNHLDLDALDRLLVNLEAVLTAIAAPYYHGWMGVDMMTHIHNGKESIMPCVELNLRMTMGVVAMKVHERLDISHPMLLNWEHNTSPAHNDITLLPPMEGFALRLKEIK